MYFDYTSPSNYLNYQSLYSLFFYYHTDKYYYIYSSNNFFMLYL